MTTMEKEALGLAGKLGLGAAGAGTVGMGAHLLKKLRSRNEQIDLDTSILNAEEEATDIISEEMASKEAGVMDAILSSLKQVPKHAETFGKAYPKAAVPSAIAAGTGIGAVGGHIAEDTLDTDREKLKAIQQYAKRRELLKGAPRFSSAEELLGVSGSSKLQNLLERRDPEGIEETIVPSAVPSAVPSDIEVPTPIDREESVSEVEDPYAELLSKNAGLMDTVKNVGRGYLDLLKGTKAKQIKQVTTPLEDAIKAAQGQPGAMGRAIDPKDLPGAQEALKKLKQHLLKARLAQAGTIGATAAVPAAIGAEAALARNVQEKAQEQQKIASDKRVFYLRMKLASDKLKKNVSGDTVIKEKDGEQEIQDVAITKTKSKTQEN